MQIFCSSSFVYANYKDYPYPKGWLGFYLDFLNNECPNVAIQTAISLKNLGKPSVDSFSIFIQNKIDTLLYDQTKPNSFRGELFQSRYELFGNFNSHKKMLEELQLPIKYQIKFYAKDENKEQAFSKLSKYYWIDNFLNDKIEALTQILNFNNIPKVKKNFYKIIFDALASNQAPLISIAADGIDSIFILKNKSKLQTLVENQISLYKDNPYFLEATMSLVNLSEKIDNDFYEKIISITQKSNLYSIRKFVSTKTCSKEIGFKELDKFDEIEANLFKYQTAIINTNKGQIKIQFDNSIAPISVANFCMLAKKNFYSEIIFHRVVPGFVIQAGDPTATGWGGPGYDIVSEFSDTDFGIGYVGMASAGKDTESSQFFIMQGSYPHLDSRYTLFAKVIEGIDVIYNIIEDDKIISIELN
jgi:cyclophilin family peptidyl-prolyl cis-trans isomerase